MIEAVYYLEQNQLVLKPEHYDMRGWPPGEAENYTPHLEACHDRGGWFYGVFEADRLIGEVVLDSRLIGNPRDMLQLKMLHISQPYRGLGLGYYLFELAARDALRRGARRLYISATPSEHTVDFYLGLGCKVTLEPDPALFALEPEDIHLVFDLASLKPLVRRPEAFPVLTTERLLMREFCLEDALAVYNMMRREEVAAWLETGPMRSVREAVERVKGRMGLFQDGMGFRWALALPEKPAELIGSCGFFHLRRGTQTVETGYDLHPDYWNRGLITEVLREMVRYSFSAQSLFPVHRIEAIVAPPNSASIRVLEKLGFQREGLRREFAFWNGSYQDVLLYALLNHPEQAE